MRLDITEDQYLEIAVTTMPDGKEFSIVHRWHNPKNGDDWVIDTLPIELAEKIKAFLDFAV